MWPAPSLRISTGWGSPIAPTRLGNLVTTLPGDPARPSVMVFAHMDQLGFIVRKIEPSGLIRLERQGGVPERALPAQAVLLCTEAGDLPGVISNKSHHATTPEEKYEVVPYARLAVDAGFASKEEAEAAGVRTARPWSTCRAPSTWRAAAWPAQRSMIAQVARH